MTESRTEQCRGMSLQESQLFLGHTQKRASRPVKLSVTQENPDGRASQDTLLPNIAPTESETPQSDAMEKPAGLLISTDVGVVSVLIQICKYVHFQHVIGHHQYRRSLCLISILDGTFLAQEISESSLPRPATFYVLLNPYRSCSVTAAWTRRVLWVRVDSIFQISTSWI